MPYQVKRGMGSGTHYGLRKGFGAVGCGDPVRVNGSPFTTQCYTYDWYAATPGSFYDIAGAQTEPMAVRLYDPAGKKPNVDFSPTDDALQILKAHGLPVQAADQGVSYAYGRAFQNLFAQNYSSGGKKSNLQLESDAVQQLLSQGWTRTQLAPWLNDVGTQGARSDPAFQSAVASGTAISNPTADETAAQNLLTSGDWFTTAPASSPAYSVAAPSSSASGAAIAPASQPSQMYSMAPQSSPSSSAAGGTSAGSTAGASSSTVIGGFDLSSIPTWAWLAAAGVALFAFGGKH